MSQRPTNPRAIALHLFREVMVKGNSLDVVLARNADLPRLESRDRAFARLLVATLLRRQGQLDAAIDYCLDRPLKPKLSGVRDLLRLGAAQLLFLETPPHAAVSTTLELARSPRLSGTKGLMNAVLRRLAREGPSLLAEQDAERLNTPSWLWQSWLAAYGEETTRAIARSHLSEPPLDLTVKADTPGWAAKLGSTSLLPGSLRLPPGQRNVTTLAGYREGAWWVQDLAASLPARLLGDVSGREVFDLCAAPGGKTAQLAAAGAQVTAVDVSAERMTLLDENLRRLDLSASLAVANLLDWRPPTQADGILLDAPCSSTGTIRRHPDIAHLKAAADVEALAGIQDRMLRTAVDWLRPGGTLVYATCSLQPEEGSERIAALLGSRSDLVRMPIEPEELGGLKEAVSADGDLRTLPCHFPGQGGLDGFYACRLRKL